jgi:hypothetical protein
VSVLPLLPPPSTALSTQVLGAGYSQDVHCEWGRTKENDVRARELQEGQPRFEDLAAAVGARAAADAQQRRLGSESYPTTDTDEVRWAHSKLTRGRQPAGLQWTLIAAILDVLSSTSSCFPCLTPAHPSTPGFLNSHV